MQWEGRGPCDRRQYAAVSAAWAAGRARSCPVRALLQLFGSAAFCRLLADCTDLALAHLHALELQRWRATDFTVSIARRRIPPATAPARLVTARCVRS